MSLWFALLGLGLAPVMVGATEVIVGNAPLELSGVAGGLQQAAMQVGGSLGTAVLGAVMASKVNADLADNWDAGLPPLTPRWSRPPSGVPGELAPVPPGTTPDIAAQIGGVTHDTFISGMSLASPSRGCRGHRRPRRDPHQARRERRGGSGRGPRACTDALSDVWPASRPSRAVFPLSG
ncbi:hypothetical protein SVIOM74S_02219 [Streptomyces violarus]